MPEITVASSKGTVLPEEERSLLALLEEQGLFIEKPCNGKGLCGKCRVRVNRGACPDLTDMERKHLSRKEAALGIRLACQCYPRGALTVEVPGAQREAKVLTTGFSPSFKIMPDIKKQCFHMEGALPGWMFSDGVIVPEGRRTNVYKKGLYTAVFYEGRDGKKTLIGLEEGDTRGVLYGAAVDLGTTTVVVSIVNLITGIELAAAAGLNPQKCFGQDVLTRIAYEMEHPDEGIARLKETVVVFLDGLIREGCAKAGISTGQVYEITVAANCTMLHMLLGVDARPIGVSPYEPVFKDALELEAETIGIHGATGARLYCLPSASSYIGADIVAGCYVCGFPPKEDRAVFIDIGTNGEIVLSDHGRMIACSCAAGPALEGMNISCGMRAGEGAIEDVKITRDGVRLKVIGDVEPAGICGSGILAAVSELVRIGIVKMNGTFEKVENLSGTDYRRSLLKTSGLKREVLLYSGDRDILLTQSDIRQVQLAKGALLSGFRTLLKRAGIGVENLDSIWIAGQFGAHLSVESLIGTGILPEEVRDKVMYVGNTSKTGAHLALLSGRAKRELEKLSGQIEDIQLGKSSNYERLFAACLRFPVRG